MTRGNKPAPQQLASPTYAPVLMAAGILCLVWGVVTSWLLSLVGFGIVVGAAVRWARDISPGSKACR
jgi:hypothetical protein